jgi:excisionase family DNA binding protein
MLLCAVTAAIGIRKERCELMKLLTVPEAARYLRMSRSSLYQRKDIPRYRRPGSRVVLFDQDELEAWLMRGRTVVRSCPSGSEPTGQQVNDREITKGVLDMGADTVYHRNARYR